MVNLKAVPYLDRFDGSKDRTMVLFNPDRPLQQSELNEQQSIVHHYLREMGNTIFTDGNLQSGMDYVITGTKIKVNDGKVYLGGKVRNFKAQEVNFSSAGRFDLGIKLEQQVITSVQDPTLLDQTSGVESYFSAGADRLEETVKLVVNDPESATIYTFVDGDLFTNTSNPELAKINDILAERTFDESGSYRVHGFDLYTEDHPTNTAKLKLVVDTGRAYVRGYQIDKPTATRIDIDKALARRTLNNEAFYYSNTTRRGKLGNAPVASVNRVTGQVQVTKASVNRGATADSIDTLANSSVFRVDKVWTESGGATTATFVQGTDYQLINGNSIDWSRAGNEPAAGTTYYVTYAYNKVLTLNTDYKITIEGTGDNRAWYVDFNGLSGNKPLVDSMVLVDYDYTLARKDLIALDEKGNIIVQAGQPDALNLVTEPNHQDPYTLVLGTVTILPDSKTSFTAKSSLSRLSMADLQKMKTRIDNLEYNDAVNALDQPAMAGINPVVLRGVFSDGFISLDKYDTGHADAKVAFSFEDAEITLPYSSSTQYVPSVIAGSSLAHVWGRLVTAPFTEDKAITQSQATETMNVNPYNTFNKQGVLKLTPSEDNWIDEDRVTITQQETSTVNVKRWWKHPNDSWVDDQINMVSNITLDAGQNWTDNMGGGKVNGAYTGTTLTAGGSQTINSMIEYMRQIDVKFTATNLIPNSNNLKMTFDGIAVPITPASGFNAGATSGTIMSNATGVASGTFKIPAGIRTGIREVTLANTDNTSSTTFIAQGTLKTTQDVIIRTRVTVNLTDPLAQSFQFDTNKVVSSIGLHFASKDTVNNVIVQIRGVSDGGMPNKTIYAETVLTPALVKVSADASLETRVTFDDPLVADAGKEYAIVLLTDSDKYTMWIATRGQNNIGGGATVVSNPYLTGVLYSSSNASAWTVHQDSDLKFSIYTAKFNPTATIEFDTMTNIKADSIVLMATYLTPQSTGCIWDMKVVMEGEAANVTVANKDWRPIANYVDLDVGSVARQVKIRATFKANENMSPLLSLSDMVFTTFLTALQGSYVSRTVDMTEAPFNKLRVSYEAFLPANTTVTPRYSIDGGTTWKNFTATPSTAVKSNEFTQFTYDEVVATGSATHKSFKVRLDMKTQNSFARPRAKALMCNMRNE